MFLQRRERQRQRDSTHALTHSRTYTHTLTNSHQSCLAAAAAAAAAAVDTRGAAPGGKDAEEDVANLKAHGCNFVIATPGRFRDLIARMPTLKAALKELEV